jgi:O-antigen/teichoic acid export membrane protein
MPLMFLIIQNIIIRGGGTLCSLSITLIITQLLGISGAGSVFSLMAILAILMPLSSLGFSKFFMRKVAIEGFNDCNKKKFIAKLYILLFTSTSISFVFFYFNEGVGINVFEDEGLVKGIFFGVWALPFYVGLSFTSHIYQSLNKNKLASLFSTLLQPFFFFILLLIFTPKFLEEISIIYVISYLLAFFTSFIYLIIRYNVSLFPNKHMYISNNDFSSTNSFWLINIITVGFIPLSILMLGILSTNESVALFSYSTKFSMLVNVIILSGSAIFFPKISKSYNDGELLTFKNNLKIFTRGIAIFGFFSALLALIAGKFIFESLSIELDYISLFVLLIGEVIALLIGPSDLILEMCNRENKVRQYHLFFTLIALLMMMFIIPMYGIIGVAIIMSFRLVLIKVVASFHLRKVLGIHSSPFSNYS